MSEIHVKIEITEKDKFQVKLERTHGAKNFTKTILSCVADAKLESFNLTSFADAIGIKRRDASCEIFMFQCIDGESIRRRELDTIGSNYNVSCAKRCIFHNSFFLSAFVPLSPLSYFIMAIRYFKLAK